MLYTNIRSLQMLCDLLTILQGGRHMSVQKTSDTSDNLQKEESEDEESEDNSDDDYDSE